MAACCIGSSVVVTSVPAAVVPTVLLVPNLARLGATFANSSATRVLFLKLGPGASPASYTTRILPNGTYQMSPSFTGTITGIWTAGVGGSCQVSEFT